MEKGEETKAPVMCAAGCGFFGNPASENYCSKCFREHQRQQQQQEAPQQAAAAVAAPIFAPAPTPAPAAAVPAPTPAPSVSAPAPAVAAAAAAAAAAAPGKEEESPAKKTKNRCFACNKKVGLLGFMCRCDQQFCGLHRYAQDHQCPFDFKKFDLELLEKNNPVIQAEKINKI